MCTIMLIFNETEIFICKYLCRFDLSYTKSWGLLLLCRGLLGLSGIQLQTCGCLHCSPVAGIEDAAPSRNLWINILVLVWLICHLPDVSASKCSTLNLAYNELQICSLIFCCGWDEARHDWQEIERRICFAFLLKDYPVSNFHYLAPMEYFWSD